MWFWWFMLCADLLIPLTMILCGRWMWKHPPKNINMVWGYRTTRSMKNMDTWEFAHERAGFLWWRLGQILLLPSFLLHLPVYGASEGEIGIVSVLLIAAQLVVMALSLFSVEGALKKNFTEEGVRK